MAVSRTPRVGDIVLYQDTGLELGLGRCTPPEVDATEKGARWPAVVLAAGGMEVGLLVWTIDGDERLVGVEYGVGEIGKWCYKED